MKKRYVYGYLLVALQFSVLLALVFSSSLLSRLRVGDLLLWLVVAGSVAVGVAAIVNNRPGNFNIHPSPKSGGSLVVQGIYRYVRHPMYAAILVFGVACVLATPDVIRLALFCVLLGVLLAKARLEEQWLCETFAGYPAYMKTTRRFLPGVF